MAIYKASLSVTYLFEADSLGEAQERVAFADLASIHRDMQEGDCIGQTDMGDMVEVPPEKLDETLLALGNDGTFFKSEEA